MRNLDSITFDAQVMGGKPCIRGLRVTVGMIVNLGRPEWTLSGMLQKTQSRYFGCVGGPGRSAPNAIPTGLMTKYVGHLYSSMSV